jgi:PAS domain-containing protein
MLDNFASAVLREGWQLFGFAGFLFLSLIAGAVALAAIRLIRTRTLDQENRRLRTALNYMSQGLCMWDAETKLLLCNDRYIEMYGMSPDFVKTGRLLREVLEHRAMKGNFKSDITQYIDAILKDVAAGRDNVKVINLPDGRIVAIAERIMSGGGWVATHDDVTEQHNVEQQRAALRATEERRAKVEAAIAKFREQMEKVLRTVGDNAAAMKSTATTLFASSNQTSERAEGAVQASSEASMNVTNAAMAADEPSRRRRDRHAEDRANGVGGVENGGKRRLGSALGSRKFSRQGRRLVSDSEVRKPRGALSYELRNQRDTSNSMILVPL